MPKFVIYGSLGRFVTSGELATYLTEKNVGKYIDSLVSKIINNDIVRRNKIKYKATLESMTNHILNIVPAEISYDELAKLFDIKSHHTAENYVDFAEKASESERLLREGTIWRGGFCSLRR